MTIVTGTYGADVALVVPFPPHPIVTRQELA